MNFVHWQSAVDFCVLAVAIYLLLRWSREARALRLTLTILAFRVGALLARQLDLLITSWVLDASTIVGLLALVVVFQPELRRALMQLDVTRRRSQHRHVPVVSVVSEAAWSLARVRCGALIVIARKDSLSELVTTGVVLDGQVSTEILESIFRKDSPVHDGATIIEGDLITRVSSVLPLTQRAQVPSEYGTRHRAGMGLTDRSDAIVVVVSEERGEVTLMWEGQARRIADAGELQTIMQTLTTNGNRASAPQSALRSPELGIKAAAVALAALVWSVTFLFPGRSVREQTVPVEFTNVPPGMTIAAQSTGMVQVWLRGTDFLFDSVNLETLVARCDLRAAHEGANIIQLQSGAFDVPFGLRIEGIAPREVNVRLASTSVSRAEQQ
jgi:diadenylate cyclase